MNFTCKKLSKIQVLNCTWLRANQRRLLPGKAGVVAVVVGVLKLQH